MNTDRFYGKLQLFSRKDETGFNAQMLQIDEKTFNNSYKFDGYWFFAKMDVCTFQNKTSVLSICSVHHINRKWKTETAESRFVS